LRRERAESSRYFEGSLKDFFPGHRNPPEWLVAVSGNVITVNLGVLSRAEVAMTFPNLIP
jgi:hypothetical protein